MDFSRIVIVNGQTTKPGTYPSAVLLGRVEIIEKKTLLSMEWSRKSRRTSTSVGAHSSIGKSKKHILTFYYMYFVDGLGP